VDKKATEVWFNGPDQIHETPPVADGRAGAIPEGDSLTHALSDRPWNVAFGHHAVATWQAPVKLPGGLKVTVLSPDKPALKTLAAEWPQITRDAGLVPGNPPLPLPALAKQFHPPANVDEIHAMAAGKFDGKNTETNQSSIALLVEYKGKRVLLGGDSWSDTMQRALKDLVPKGSAGLPVDLVKVPHHGSIHNTSLDLLKMLDCNRFAISTSGRTHHHPDPECIARIITSKTGAQLYFNYRSDESGIWDRQDWKDEFKYATEYASPDTQGWLAIDI
jgi:hypothetical protein